MNGVSETGYGVDVSTKRADELEKRLLNLVRSDDRVLDLGCGAGGAAARLAAAQAVVAGVDQYDFSDRWSAAQGEFIQADVRNLSAVLDDSWFDYCLCNRTLHYLQYVDAKMVLHDLRTVVSKQLFVSFSGITSELATGYTKCHEPIQDRFCKLDLSHQKIFGIAAQLTLYSEAEAIKLLTDTGWHVTWSRTTDFGNVLVQAQS